ncbi:hypothetical protein PS406_08755 [Pediococcus acidilactici]
MKLVKIDEMGYINADKVDLIIKDGSNKTRIYFGGRDKDYPVWLPIEKVLDAICGSEEHSFIGYKKMKNKDLLQKVYVDVNNGSEEHLVNDANMNILKAESINSGHLNQQKCPSR